MVKVLGVETMNVNEETIEIEKNVKKTERSIWSTSDDGETWERYWDEQIKQRGLSIRILRRTWKFVERNILKETYCGLKEVKGSVEVVK